MANQIEPRFHLGVKVDGNNPPNIVARTAAVSAITNPGAGVYRVQYPTSPIGLHEEVHALETEAEQQEEGVSPSSGSCLRISDTEYEIHTFNAAGAAQNEPWSFAMYRVSSSNGT